MTIEQSNLIRRWRAVCDKYENMNHWYDALLDCKGCPFNKSYFCYISPTYYDDEFYKNLEQMLDEIERSDESAN